MNAQEEQRIVSRIAQAFSMLSDKKRECILYWAEGVIAALDKEQPAV